MGLLHPELSFYAEPSVNHLLVFYFGMHSAETMPPGLQRTIFLYIFVTDFEFKGVP